MDIQFRLRLGKTPCRQDRLQQKKAENKYDLKGFILHQLKNIAGKYGISLERDQYDEAFDELLTKLSGINKMEDGFKDYIDRFAETEGISKFELIEKITYWYDGFCFSGICEKVFNPFRETMSRLFRLLQGTAFRSTVTGYPVVITLCHIKPQMV